MTKIRTVCEHESRRGGIDEVFSTDASNECIVRRRFEKFRSDDLSFTNESRGRSETEVDNDEMGRKLAARFEVTIATTLEHLKQIGKIKKFDRWVLHELNEWQERYDLGAAGEKRSGLFVVTT